MSLEGSVGDIGTGVVHVWHNRLVHGTIPRNEARLSENVSPGSLVVHVVDWGLASSPLSVCIGHWGVLGQHTGHVPEEQIGVVSESLHVEGVIVHNQRSVRLETAAKTSNHEPHAPNVGKAASSVEVSNWQLTNHSQTKSNTDLSAGSVASPVEVRLVDGSSDLRHVTAGEPSSQNSELLLGLLGPCKLLFLESMLGHTETNKIVVLNVLSELRVDLSSLQVIIGVLKANTN